MTSTDTSPDPRTDRTRPPSFLASTGFAVATLVLSTFLLVTMGGAILAAPLTVPALVVIARTRVGWQRIAGIVVPTLTIGEVAWAFTYLLAGEAKPWIWLTPVACAAATALMLRRRVRWRRSP